ncbi:MAG TPA: hypothetical protein VIN05_08215 [Roseovarius sp.]
MKHTTALAIALFASAASAQQASPKFCYFEASGYWIGGPGSNHAHAPVSTPEHSS